MVELSDLDLASINCGEVAFFKDQHSNTWKITVCQKWDVHQDEGSPSNEYWFFARVEHLHDCYANAIATGKSIPTAVAGCLRQLGLISEPHKFTH